MAFWGSGSSFGQYALEFGRTDSIAEGGTARHGCRTQHRLGQDDDGGRIGQPYDQRYRCVDLHLAEVGASSRSSSGFIAEIGAWNPGERDSPERAYRGQATSPVQPPNALAPASCSAPCWRSRHGQGSPGSNECPLPRWRERYRRVSAARTTCRSLPASQPGDASRIAR